MTGEWIFLSYIVGAVIFWGVLFGFGTLVDVKTGEKKSGVRVLHISMFYAVFWPVVLISLITGWLASHRKSPPTPPPTSE